MEKRPLVSVIIPAYNCAGLISRAIESVLIQEVSLEIIVIDDGSGDNLEQVLETYRDNPAFSFIKNKTNLEQIKEEEEKEMRETGKQQ